MFTLFARSILFYAAYAPFFILLLVKNPLLCPLYTAIASVLIFLSSVFFVKLLIRRLQRPTPWTGQVEITENQSTETLSYLMTYMIPFIMDIGGIREYIFLGLLLILLCVFYVSTDLMRHNLILMMLGYKVYKVRISGRPYFIIIRDTIDGNEATLRLRKVNRNAIWYAELEESSDPD